MMSEAGEMEEPEHEGTVTFKQFKSLQTFKALNKIDRKSKEYIRIKNVLDELVETSKMISNIRKYLVKRGYIRRNRCKKRMKKKLRQVSLSTQTEIFTSYKLEPSHFAYFIDKINHVSSDGFLPVKVFAYILQDIMDEFRNSDDTCMQLPETWSMLTDDDLITLSCKIMVQHGTVNWKHFLMNCMDIQLPTQEDLISALEQFQCLDVHDQLYVDKNKFDLVSLWFEPLEPDLIVSNPKALLWRECIFQLFKNMDGQMLYVDFLLFCCRDSNPFKGITKALAIFVGGVLSTDDFPTELMTDADFEFTDSDMEILFTEDEEQSYYHRGSVVVPFIPEGRLDRTRNLMSRMRNIKKRRQTCVTLLPCMDGNNVAKCAFDEEIEGEEENEMVRTATTYSEVESTIEEISGEDIDEHAYESKVSRAGSETITKQLSATNASTESKLLLKRSRSKSVYKKKWKSIKNKTKELKLNRRKTESKLEQLNNGEAEEEEEEEGEHEEEQEMDNFDSSESTDMRVSSISNLKVSPETMLNVLWFGHICAFPFNSLIELTNSYTKLKNLVDEMYEDVSQNYSVTNPDQSDLVNLFQHQLMHQLLRRYRVFHEMDFDKLIKEGMTEIPTDSINIAPLLESSEDEEAKADVELDLELKEEINIPGSPLSETPSWYSNESSTDEEEYFNSYYSKAKPYDKYKHFMNTGTTRQHPDDYIVTKDGEVVSSSHSQFNSYKPKNMEDIFGEEPELPSSESQTSILGLGIDPEMLADFNELLLMDKKERDDKMAAGFTNSRDKDEESLFIKQTLMHLRKKKYVEGEDGE